LKNHVRQDLSVDDTYLTALITAARQYSEIECQRQFINATWTWTLDRFEQFLHVPMSPLQSITSFQYVDPTGATQTVDPTIYVVDTNNIAPRIGLVWGQIWPFTAFQINVVTIVFVAGFGPDATYVPEDIKTAIKMIAASWYENREEIDSLPFKPVPVGAHWILRGYKPGNYR
jgi:uncharacterized phiE125 gp8 family phage protein